MTANKNKALFICLGNICRSPIAEGVFQKTVNDMGLGDKWEIDSAAIGGWHVGNPPDWRALDTMKKHDVPYNNCARQITSEDFKHYDYIFGMDEANMRDLKKRAPKDSTAKLLLFGDFDPEGDKIIRDPYYKILGNNPNSKGISRMEANKSKEFSRMEVNKSIKCQSKCKSKNPAPLKNKPCLAQLKQNRRENSRKKVRAPSEPRPSIPKHMTNPESGPTRKDSDAKGFEKCYQQSVRCSKGFLDQLAA